jgi:hypothetical protein
MDHLVGLFDPGSNDRSTLREALPPEVEEGNVEYKLKLMDPTPSRLEHLVTQMKWRLQEGQGEAIYQIGVEDCGLLAGLTDEEMKASLRTNDPRHGSTPRYLLPAVSRIKSVLHACS